MRRSHRSADDVDPTAFGKQRPRAWSPEPSRELSREANLRYRRCSRNVLRSAGPDPDKNREIQDLIQEDVDWLYVYVRMQGSPRTTDIVDVDAYRSECSEQRLREAIQDKSDGPSTATLNGDPILPREDPPSFAVMRCAELLETLTARQKAVMTCVHLLGLSLAETAETLQLSKQAVSRAISSARSRARTKKI